MNWVQFVPWAALFALGAAFWLGAVLVISAFLLARRTRRKLRRSLALAAGIRDEQQDVQVLNLSWRQEGWETIPTGDDLEAVMDAVRDAEPLEVDGPVVPRYVDRYASRDLIPYGRSKVHAGCMLARADAASDHICALCAVEFVRSVIA